MCEDWSWGWGEQSALGPYIQKAGEKWGRTGCVGLVPTGEALLPLHRACVVLTMKSLVCKTCNPALRVPVSAC